MDPAEEPARLVTAESARAPRFATSSRSDSAYSGADSPVESTQSSQASSLSWLNRCLAHQASGFHGRAHTSKSAIRADH